MKYAEELYIDSGFYEADEDIQNYKEKIVKCRKPHTCMGCDKTIEIEEQALSESGFLDNKPVSAYTCLPCIEKWLEESGQVDYICSVCGKNLIAPGVTFDKCCWDAAGKINL